MNLPNDSVGISDILTFLDCPMRFAYQMRRHVEGSDPPEDQHPDTMYGKAIHDAISAMEDNMLTVEEAVQYASALYPRWLDPDDLDRLRKDLATYEERDEIGVTLVANETEIRVPLMEWEGRTIYFRGRIDRLYERVGAPGHFVHRDYKSSKHRKSEDDVHNDKQMWAYNWGIHEWWPECERLEQVYDQLLYGEVPTSKNADQRRQMKEWLVAQVTAILELEEPEPTANQWCPWCPLILDCSEPLRMARWAQARVKELAGDTGKLPSEVADAGDLSEYVADLDELLLAGKMVKTYDESLKAIVKELPLTRQQELGFKRSQRSSDYWSPDALRAAHRLLGDDFYMLIGLTKKKAEGIDDEDKRTAVLGMRSHGEGTPTLRRT